jgi:hypothetical protein
MAEELEAEEAASFIGSSTRRFFARSNADLSADSRSGCVA